MKQVVLLFSALILISCNKFKVEGTAKGVKDGTKVFLEGSGEMGPIAMDTVEIKEGKFEFEGKSDLRRSQCFRNGNDAQTRLHLL